MKNLTNICVLLTLTISMMGFAACSASFSTGAPNTAKPANSTASTANSKPATNSASTFNSTATKPAEDKSKKEVTGGKRPDNGSAKTAHKENAVPKDWDYIYNEGKGYGFYVPAGTTYETESKDGADIWSGTTPAPSNVDMFVLAYKDKTLTKEDLLEDAVKFLEETGQTKVTTDKLKAESEDYSIVDATSVHPTAGKVKLRILVGTDVSDNYIMIIGTEEDKFAANEKIIDELWGNFEMWSGGASKN